jgi:hypothetical protein
MMVTESLSPQSQKPSAESQYMQFFILKLSSTIAAPLDTGAKAFWTTIVPLLSEHAPAVRYAIISLSSLMQPFYRPEDGATFNLIRPYSQTTLSVITRSRQYHTKAIQATLKAIDSGPIAIEVAFATCIIFRAVESIQQHNCTAYTLYRQAEGLYQSLFSNDPTRPSNKASKALIARMTTQLPFFGPPHANCCCTELNDSPEPLIAARFASLDEAIVSLVSLTKRIRGFSTANILRKWKLKDNPNLFSRLTSQQTALSTELQQWRVRGGPVLVMNEPIVHRPCSPILQALHCQYFILTVCIINALVTIEESYDSYYWVYCDVIHLMRSITKSRGDKNLTHALELGLDLSFALGFVAFKCRDPGVRREALSLLRMGSEAQMWEHGDRLVRILERVIEAEEGAGSEKNSSEKGRHDHRYSVRDVLILPQKGTVDGVSMTAVKFVRKRHSSAELEVTDELEWVDY